MKLKRIIFCVSTDLSYDQRMKRICSAFSADMEVLLLGRELPESIPLAKETYQQYRLKCKFNKGILFYLEFQFRLFFYLLKNPSDWIAAADTDTLLGAGLAKIISGRKLLFDAHEYFTEVPELINKPLVRTIWNQVEEAIMPLTQTRMTVGPMLADLFSKKFGLPFACIRNVPELKDQAFRGIRQNPEFTILYQGALNKGRCLEQLIEAVEGLPVKVLIAGEGDLSRALRENVLERKMESQVQFLGYVKPVDLVNITPSCHIGFNVLEPLGLSYRYSLANKFFDYIHGELPQLCSDFEEYSALNTKYEVAILCQPTVQSIRKRLEFVIAHSDLLIGMKENCKKATFDLNWDMELRELQPLILQCLK